jgi:phosphoglycolate phosphatase
MTRRLVLFDCDGTLVDSQHDIVAAMTHAFEVCGLAAPPRLQTLSVVGLSVPEAITALIPSASAATHAVLATAFRAGAPTQHAAGGKSDPLYSGAAELVAALAGRENLALGVATGKSRRGVARLFDRYGWHPHFETVQTADTNPSKPHPGMIETACGETGVAAEHCLMIGDTSFDMAMAAAAGVRSIGVAWGYHPVPAIAAAGAHAIVHDFDALRTAIEAWCEV